jgi:hydroxyethylthiazole kinase-like uncharacterized protein yjeF
VETLVDASRLTGETAAMARAFEGPVHPVGKGDGAVGLYVDALFGAGLNRPLEPGLALLADELARTPERVVAVDVPSGVHGDTGRPLGQASFVAGLTVTFAAKKPAHVLQPGKDLCGEVVVADIGMPDAAWADIGPTGLENGTALWRAQFPMPMRQAHKHARGHAMVVSGTMAQTGAARLAATAALRVGAGLVTMLSPPSALLVHASHLTAVMLRAVRDTEELVAACAGAAVTVIGPAAGVTPATRAAVLALLQAPGALVLDADALSVFQGDSGALFSALRPGDVMTPHVGEFNRLFPGLLGSTENRIAAALAAARQAGCVVLLKGPDTVIASPEGRTVVNGTGSPYLATAGSGDVLAGLIAGLIAQGMPGFEAACAGAWLHGLCGEALGPGLISEDLPAVLPRVLQSFLAP